MAKKTAYQKDSDSFQFDTARKVMAQNGEPMSRELKEKIQRVRDCLRHCSHSNDEIILVLQHYNEDVDRCVQAFMDDGAAEALKDWVVPNKKSKNQQKRNRKKANKQMEMLVVVGGGGGEVNGSAHHVNGVVANGSAGSEEIDSTISDFSAASEEDHIICNGVSPTTNPTKVTTDDVDVVIPSTTTLTSAALPQRQRTTSSSSSSARHQQHHKQPHHPTTVAAGAAPSHPPPSQIHDKHQLFKSLGLERSSKDLNRQATALTRHRSSFNEQVEASSKSINKLFDELQKELDTRKTEVIKEMEELKLEGNNLLDSRQARAAHLKAMLERVGQMTETDVIQLKLDVKHFASERKLDEDLARQVRFIYDDDVVVEHIKKFGEVVAIANHYTQRERHASTLSSSSTVVSADRTVDADVAPSVPTHTTHHPTSEAKLPRILNNQ